MKPALTYTPGALRPRAAHLGVGAFHRAHQQSYYDDLARAGGDWGVVGINLTPPDLAAAHAAQNGIYAVLTDDGQTRACRGIGTLIGLHDSRSAPGVDWSGIDFATLTITEKGYCHRSGSFELDPAAVAADLAAPEAPVTAIGYLAWMLERRRRAGGEPITLASCDNVADNGTLLGAVLRDYAARAFPGLPDWIDRNVAFPTSMVDRIVPAMSASSRARLEAACGGPDALGVVAEPFRQWVIENRFAGPRPELERAGVQIVDDLAPHEHMKHRLLNGLQSAYAELGRLCGHESSHDAATDPVLSDWAGLFFRAQAETLACPEGEDLTAYGRTSLARLQNPTIHHPLNQIASDASFKLPQRIAAPAAERLARGGSAELQAMVLAGWALQAGDTRPDSTGVPTRDPMGEEMSRRRAAARDAAGFAREVLALPLWPARLGQDAGFVADMARWLRAFAQGDPRQRRAQIDDFVRERANA